jgi:hypothetical protein
MEESKMHELVDKSALWKVDGISVRVIIQGMRRSYGRFDAQIKPVSGEGIKWVDLNNLKVED